MTLQFEWDPIKAALNKIKHGVTFEQAITAFDDPGAVKFFDAVHSQNEDRYKLIGLSGVGILLVVHTFRGTEPVCRLISARKASRRELKDYYEEKGKN